MDEEFEKTKKALQALIDELDGGLHSMLEPPGPNDYDWATRKFLKAKEEEG